MMIRSEMSPVLAVLLGVAVACGTHTSSATPVPQPQRIYSCGLSGTRPPAKLIIPPSGGISGSWIVFLNEDVTGLHTIAADLAAKYDGVVTFEYDTVNGFALTMDDVKAPALSSEPTVCFVEQDQTGSGT